RFSFVITAVLLLISGILVYFGVTEQFTPVEKTQKKGRPFWQEWRDVWQTPNISIVYGLRFLSNLGQSLFTPFASLIIATLVVDGAKLNTLTGLTIGITAGAGTLTAVYLGRLGDRIGYRKVLMASAVAAGLLCLPQIWVTEAWQLLLLQ